MHRPVDCLRAVLLTLSFCPAAAVASGPGVTGATQQQNAAREVHRDTSPPLREMLATLGPDPTGDPTDYVVPNIFLDLDDFVPGSLPESLPPAQRSVAGTPTPPVGVAVNGMRIGLGGGGVPPDTTGDVGPQHFFQWVNTSWALFDKATGDIVPLPGRPNNTAPGSSFWAGFGGVCQTTNRGDPLVLWDGLARRWVVSQFAFNSTSVAPWLQCVAVSTSEDPLGSYHRYAFAYPAFNDYGKMGVWVTEDGGQNAYVLSMHEFSGSFVGSSFAVIERDRMLNGQSAQFIRFGGIDTFGGIPFHLEGDQPLPAGLCPVFVHFSFGRPGYELWDLCVDWRAGSGSFDPQPGFVASEPFVIGLNGIPQRDSTTRLDDFGSNTMYIAALRAFGPTGPLEAQGVIHHAVNVGGDQAGARWVQFGLSAGAGRPTTGNAVFVSGFESGEGRAPAIANKRIIDQGTYAPDSDSRWMGGINIDRSGNIMMGYNVSSAAINPEIRIAGRLRNDPAGTLRPEAQCSPTGTGAQTGLFSGRARWGDYATMGVDPNDECTFWFTNEYYPVTAQSSWSTRICSIRFPSCGEADFLLETTPNARIAVCGSNAQANVRVGEFGLLGGSVTLGQGSLPTGASLAFGTPTLAAGESTTVTVNGSAALADGLYSAEVTGSAGAINRSVEVQLGVSATVPGSATLSGPAPGSTGIVTRPTYQWTAASGAVDYLIEVATDAAFTQIIESAVVVGTSYTSNVLLGSSTQHFWRLTPRNFCGASASPSSASFTTGVPGSCPGGTAATQLFFDDVSADAIAWQTENAQGGAGTLWTRQTPPAGTGITTRAWFAANSPVTADQRLISPAVVLPSDELPLVLAFDAFHRYETDGAVNCWDGGFVEVSADDGASWSELGNARNLADPYPGQLSSGNPAAPAQAWCRQPPGGSSVRSIFLLDGFAGQSVRFRFRSTADSNTTGTAPAGWAIDNILVQGCAAP